MLAILMNVVLPVLAVAALGYGFGRRSGAAANMDFINHANVMMFCPAFIFSSLLAHPIHLAHDWPLVAAGVLTFVLPGLLLRLLPSPGRLRRPAILVPGMFRNTGNLGIPLMVLAYGQDQLGSIVVLFVISTVLFFSLGLFLYSSGSHRWRWLTNPNLLAAVLALVLAPVHEAIPAFATTAIDLTGQLAIPLMLFGLGVRLSQDKITRVGVALKINLLYLAVSVVAIPIVFWLLPLTPEWKRLITLSLILPPAVLNYLISEQYQIEPETVANVVLLGNVLSVITIPLTVWATLHWI